MKRRALIAFILTGTLSQIPFARAQERVNEGAAIQQNFAQNIADYMKLRSAAIGNLPPDGAKNSAAVLEQQREFAERIRRARPSAKQGDICTPEIAIELRRLIQLAMSGANRFRIRESLRRAEPVNVPVQVNAAFPDNVPLQSTPPTLLANLPRLPRELEYRIVGKSLVLLDTTANLIVDFVPDALPAINKK